MTAPRTAAARRDRRPLALAVSAAAACAALSATTAVTPTVPAAAPAVRVVVTGGTGTAGAVAAVVAAGGRVLDRLPLVGGVSAELPAGAVLPRPYAAVPDRAMGVSGRPDPSPVLSAGPRGTLGLGAPTGEGRGVTVAVVDTGVADVPGLPPVAHVDVTGSGPGDGFGHGTFVAGLVAGTGTADVPAGVAPGAALLDVRVAGDDGSTSLVQVLRGLQVVADHPEVDVVNLSLSSGSPLPPQVDPLAVALEALWRRGVVVVVPSGNAGPTPGSVSSPGDDPLLLTVGGLDEHGTTGRADDTVAAWSGRGRLPRPGDKPDLVAPGTSLVSLRAPGSAADTGSPGARVGATGFRGSGTSFSTAVTSGAAAALLATRPLSPDQVKALLTGTTYGGPALTRPDGAGSGGVDLAAALAARTPAAGPRTAADLPPSTDTAAWDALAAALSAGDPEAAANSWSGLSPASRAWASRAWGELDPALRAAGTAAWADLAWAGAPPVEWASRDWAAQRWVAGTWASGSWADGEWASRNWASRNWVSSDWASRNWVSRNWVSRNWASRNWVADDWASRNWASRNWASGNWASRNWAATDWS